jgi:hypothetical protein
LSRTLATRFRLAFRYGSVSPPGPVWQQERTVPATFRGSPGWTQRPGHLCVIAVRRHAPPGGPLDDRSPAIPLRSFALSYAVGRRDSSSQRQGGSSSLRATRREPAVPRSPARYRTPACRPTVRPRLQPVRLRRTLGWSTQAKGPKMSCRPNPFSVRSRLLSQGFRRSPSSISSPPEEGRSGSPRHAYDLAKSPAAVPVAMASSCSRRTWGRLPASRTVRGSPGRRRDAEWRA